MIKRVEELTACQQWTFERKDRQNGRQLNGCRLTGRKTVEKVECQKYTLVAGKYHVM